MRLVARALVGALLLGSFALVDRPAQAASTVTDLDGGIGAADLVTKLLGPSVTATNITYTGTNHAAGTFTGAFDAVGFDEGIVLSSGDINELVPGPNDNDQTSTTNGTGNDADLDALVNSFTYDKSVLEFDFAVASPDATVDLSFDYVFSSEEYNEYVNSGYNDVFGFFVDGHNCATVSDPPVPVSINTINNGNPFGSNATNPSLYRNNDLSDGGGAIDTELDGLTVVLTCSASISSGGTHHLKLAIADVADSAFDSAVFLRANSFTFAQDTTLVAEPSIVKVVPGANLYFPNLTATLTALDGTPLANAPIDFSVGGSPLCTGTTDNSGVARCSATVSQQLSIVTKLGYDAAFAGDGPYNASYAHGPIVAVGPIKLR